MDAQQLIGRIYELTEAAEVDKAVMASLRLARAVGDTFNVIMFLRELHPDVAQLQAAFYQETKDLNSEARGELWRITLERWIAERTATTLTAAGEEANVLGMGVGELGHEIEQMTQSIEDLRLPPGLGEFDTAAFTDQHIRLKGEMRLKIRACREILERIRTRCFHYANRIDGQLAAERRTSDLVGSVQRDVHNFYAERSEEVFQSLRKAASLIDSSDPEDHALLLTSVRRAVKAAADYHYPPASAPVVCADGQTRVLGEDRYLNRLQEFCNRTFQAGSSTALLRAELDYLCVFMRRLNDVASKGVHAQVTMQEARQGLIGVYLFLSNVIAKSNMGDVATTEASTS